MEVSPNCSKEKSQNQCKGQGQRVIEGRKQKTTILSRKEGYKKGQKNKKDVRRRQREREGTGSSVIPYVLSGRKKEVALPAILCLTPD